MQVSEAVAMNLKTSANRLGEPVEAGECKVMVMDLNLTKKLALVTGSTAGIGRAIAAALSREGAVVIVNGRSQDSVRAVVAGLHSSSQGEVHGFVGDLSTASAAKELFRQYPDVEILINNLGIYEAKPFDEIPDADWIRLFEVNVLSGVRLARLYLPGMKRRNWGRIIYIQRERDSNPY